MNSTEEQIKLLESRKKALEEDIIEIEHEIKNRKKDIKSIILDGTSDKLKLALTLMKLFSGNLIYLLVMIDNDSYYYEIDDNFSSGWVSFTLWFELIYFLLELAVWFASIANFIPVISLPILFSPFFIAIIIEVLRNKIISLSRRKYIKPIKKYIKQIKKQKSKLKNELKAVKEEIIKLNSIKTLEAIKPLEYLEIDTLSEQKLENVGQTEKQKIDVIEQTDDFINNVNSPDNSFSLYSLSLKIELLIKKTPKEKRKDYMVRLRKIMQEHKELLDKSNLDEGTKFMGEQSILSKLINLEVDVEMNQDKKLERESNYNSINYLLDNIILEDNFIKNLEMVNSIIKEIEDKKESLSIVEQREIDNKIANIYVDIISLAMNNHDFNKELIKKIKYEYVIFITNIIEEKGNLLESNIELQQDIAKLKQYKECNYYDYITNMLYLLNSDKDTKKRVLAIN